MEYKKSTERISFRQKNANSKAWFKQEADRLDGLHYDIDRGSGGVSDFKRMKVNYDLFNNILDLKDFEYV